MINIKIQKKDLWLLAAIMVFLVGVAYVIAYNPGGTGGNPAIMGHSADEIESVGFGAWESKSVNTVYQAATDGFIMARGYFTAANGWIVIRTDGANPPTITRQSKGATATTGSDYIYSVMSPVRKGDFYKVETSGFIARTPEFPAFDNIYWLPTGS